MTQKSINYSKVTAVLAGGALIAAIAAPAYFASNADNGLTELQVQEAMQKAIALQSFDINVTDSPKTIAIYEEIFEEDALEAESEVLALEELEDDDYEELGRFLISEYDNLEDEDDIDNVIVRDVDISGLDVDDKDSTVKLELKVYYENLNGKSIKKYITAIVTIEDGEVEDLSFVETD